MSKHKRDSRDSKIQYVDEPGRLAEVARELATEESIAFDTEFLWEKSYSPRLGLIQVANGEQSWLVDPLALSKSDMEPLLEVLVAPQVLKVAHAIDQDQMCLHQTYGAIAEPAFDTSIAAALTGLGDQIGLSKLLEKLLRVKIDKGYTRTDWLKRPLAPEMLRYAADDVAYLTKAADMLRKDLVRLGRMQWALDLSSGAGRFAMAHFEPEALAHRIADGKHLDATAFAVLREVVAWREQQSRRLDIPRRWMADDKMLIKLATARPDTAKRLADFRGLGTAKRPDGAATLLAAIRRGVNSKADGYAKPKRKAGATPSESAALVVLRCFLVALAADHKVPLRMIAHSDDMLELLRGRFETVNDLRGSGILSPRAVDLVGEELVEILSGKRSLCLVNGVASLQAN